MEDRSIRFAVRSLAGALCLVLAVAGLARAKEGAVTLSPERQKCAELFMAAANEPVLEQVSAFESAFASAERRKSVPAPERAKRLESMKQEFGDLRITGVLGSGPGSFAVSVDSSKVGALAFEFQYSVSEPERIEGIVIMPAGEYRPSVPVDREEIGKVVEAAAKAVTEGYVFPDKGAEMAALVRANLAKGDYDSITDETTLARRLTKDMRSVTNDKHLGIRPEMKREGRAHGPSAEEIAGSNFGFRKVEVLPGNIGYVKFDAFVDSEAAQEKATQALAFVENASALIFDLRQNGGGSPEQIRFITSYLFGTPTHLNDMVDREGKVVEEYWTLAEVPGKRFSDSVPVFVLTSGRTFSGAEEFSYNLKNLGRATIVGEVTGGGAHPVRGEPLNDRLVIGIPFMRAQNPISKTNWEAVGVKPDVEVPADQALDRALELAKKAIDEKKPKM